MLLRKVWLRSAVFLQEKKTVRIQLERAAPFLMVIQPARIPPAAEVLSPYNSRNLRYLSHKIPLPSNHRLNSFIVGVSCESLQVDGAGSRVSTQRCAT